MHAHQLSGLAVTHPPAGQGGRELLGGSDGPLAPLGVVRQDAQGKDREVGLGDDEHAVTRTPYLDKRRILPCGGAGALDARMDRQQRGPRHAVLQPRPRGSPQRGRSRGQPLVERADASSERQDLRPRQLEPGGGHVAPPARWSLERRPGFAPGRGSFASDGTQRQDVRPCPPGRIDDSVALRTNKHTPELGILYRCSRSFWPRGEEVLRTDERPASTTYPPWRPCRVAFRSGWCLPLAPTMASTSAARSAVRSPSLPSTPRRSAPHAAPPSALRPPG